MKDKYFEKALEMVDLLMRRVHSSSITDPNHNDKKVIEMTAKHMIDFRAENPPWISVDDEMPEAYKGRIVNGQDMDPDKTIKVLVITDMGQITDNFRLKMQTGEKQWVWFMDYDGEEVTHWMTAPKPPT